MRVSFDVPPSVAAARDTQERLRDRVIRAGSPKWSLVAGVDAGRAAVVEEAVAEGAIPFPYVPGYLSFREIVGHRISRAAAVKTVLACAPRYRLPEPRRLADPLSKRPWTSSASSA